MNNKLSAGALFTVLSLLAFFIPEGTASAQCRLYRGADGQDIIGRVDGSMIYKGMYGFDIAAHFSEDVVYKGDYGFDVLGHFSGPGLFKERFGSEPMGRMDKGLIFKDGEKEAAGRAEGCKDEEAAALAIALLSGLL